MNHQNSPWANDDGGFHRHHHQQAAGTHSKPTPREQQRQGWLVAEQPTSVGGWGGSSGCGNQALDDAMDRFGGMTIGSNVAGSGDGGGADDLDMSSLRLAEGGTVGGSGFGLSAVAQVRHKQKRGRKHVANQTSTPFPATLGDVAQITDDT
ncbi:unnamed protein product [Ectocarpus sp. 13 AM-2016]